MSFLNFSMSKTPWDVLEFSSQSVQAAGALQACCRPTAHPLYMHLKLVTAPWPYCPGVLGIASMDTQQACCRLTAHPLHIHLKYVDMDVIC